MKDHKIILTDEYGDERGEIIIGIMNDNTLGVVDIKGIIWLAGHDLEDDDTTVLEV